MAKKEFKVGEVFQFGLIKLKVVPSNGYCKKCFLDGICEYYGQCIKLVGECCMDHREDKTDVIFVKVEE